MKQLLFTRRDDGQLVLAGGVSMAFAILLIAGLSQLGTEMDADQDIEPLLGPEFTHVRSQFEMAVIYQYSHSNGTAEEVFNETAEIFIDLEVQYGLYLTFDITNLTGPSGNKTIEYRMEMVSKEQLLAQDGVLTLIR
jgi:hypothetical protein